MFLVDNQAAAALDCTDDQRPALVSMVAVQGAEVLLTAAGSWFQYAVHSNTAHQKAGRVRTCHARMPAGRGPQYRYIKSNPIKQLQLEERIINK